MEDNEFEEVTIISHTDQAASILPQQTAERLMKEIRMEVTQKISPTENIKYGSSQHSAASTELDQLKERFFGEGPGRMNSSVLIRFTSSRHVSLDSKYLLGAEGAALLSNAHRSEVMRFAGYVASITRWGRYFLIRRDYDHVEVIDEEFLLVHRTEECCGGSPCHRIRTTNDHFYFETDDLGVVRVDRDFNSELLFADRLVQDFFVCPKTEAITTLDGRGSLTRGDSIMNLPEFQDEYVFNLVPLYSDHFLVPGFWAECDYAVQIIHLVDYETLTLLHTHKTEIRRFMHQEIPLISVLAPRQGINCFLVALGDMLQLFCEYRLKLYHLKTLQTEKLSGSLSHQIDDSWMIGCDRCTIYSFRVIFPPSLHY